jgi:dTDP-4-dehydrorhamnose reductase
MNPPRESASILVTGANGQLGREICRQLGPAAVPLPRAAVDITDADAVNNLVAQHQPRAVINCAAWTAVDAAEAESAACWAANATAVGSLADACKTHGATLVQISSDYVFGADRARRTPYRETDPPGPLGVYGASKLAGETAARRADKHLIVRTCGLYSVGEAGPVRGRNFLDTMLILAAAQRPLRVVDDQFCTPSFVPHVATAVLSLLATDAEGLFHVTNSGETSWHALAGELFAVAGITTELSAIPTSGYPTPAARPGYSVLDTTSASRILGASLPDWRDAVAEYVGLLP